MLSMSRARPRSARAATVAAGFLMLAGFAAARVAPPTPALPPERDPVVLADLASPDWAVREAASRRLRNSRTLDPSIVRSPEFRDLPLEARFRVLDACYEAFVAAPLGALGVRHEPAPAGEPGIVLRDVIPGFDAATKLRPQDVVLAIDGLPMDDPRALARAVQRRRPGEAVVVEFQRPVREGDRIVRDADNRVTYGPRTRIEVSLGSFQSLPQDDWSSVRQASSVPVERRQAWAEALIEAGARPRQLELPEAAREPLPSRTLRPPTGGPR